MTKKVDTWMPFLIDKYLGDTTHLTTEQHGAYMLLLLTMWKRGGELPNDDAQLSAISRLAPAKWRTHRSVILAFFRNVDGVLLQKRLSMELVAANDRSEKKSGAGKKGAEKRWQSDGTANGNAIGKADGTGMANGKQDAWQTGASISIPSAIADTETALAVSARGAVGIALKAGGIDPMGFNLDDPRLVALVEQGATPAEFEGLAREAITKGIGKPFAWVLAVLPDRRSKAATLVLAPPPADPQAWRKTDIGIRRMAAQLGIEGLRPGESFEDWDRRVMAAWRRAGEPQPKPPAEIAA